MSKQQKNTGIAVAMGIIIGSVLTAITGDGIWIAIGVVAGAAVGAAVHQMGKI